MLVLSRKPQETVVVGEATITIKGIRRGRVCLGIDAPKHIRIARGEKIAGPDEARPRTEFEFQPAA